MSLLNFIGGEFVPAENGKTFSKLSPFDGSHLFSVAHSDAMDVIKAIQSAKKATSSMRDMSYVDRASLLHRLADYLEKNQTAVAQEEALSQGLEQSFVLKQSVGPAISSLRTNAQSLLSEPLPTQEVQPTGLVGIVTSWCLSLRLICERLAPALAAGNAVLIKVSEYSPGTARILGEAFRESGVPPGAVGILQGFGDVGNLIAGHPSIRAVAAVGKTSTLENIAQAGIGQFKKMQLSGGAKNDGIVLLDTDYRQQMPQILEPFLKGQGQLCWNMTRLFIPESIADDFVKVMKDFLSSISQWTPLISENACANIEKKIREGVTEHGKVVFGGRREPGTGFFYPPTVMLDLPNCSVLQQEELGGPLLLVTPVKYQHEAIKWSNTSFLGHSAIVWGTAEKALKVAKQLDVAHVGINSWLDGAEGPIFGHKQSSFGNLDTRWWGSFYSDIKKLAGPI